MTVLLENHPVKAPFNRVATSICGFLPKSMHLLALAFYIGVPCIGAEKISTADAANRKVSFYREVRPILQANCQGCHQPAKPKGGYVMTDFKKLLAGGENEGAAIDPAHPDKSAMLKMVTPENGEASMPKGKPALQASDVALIRTWIKQGAQDDTPPDAKKHFDLEHPPVYSRPPVITSLDYSPDGKLLAVAGFHEVLLYETENTKLAARLIGLSERVIFALLAGRSMARCGWRRSRALG